MQFQLGFILLLLRCVFVSTLQASSEPTIDLGYAKYTGIRNDTLKVTTFFGIYYAQPPTGDLRFRAPLPIEEKNTYNVSVPLNASVQGPECIQGTPGWQVTNSTPSPQPGSEDCLLLDVLVPETPRNTSLPVMVQIHGGGYASRNAETYTGYALVNQSQGGLVFVTIQYRLNAFGWLGSEEVMADGTANAGLLDQRLALEWVQRHIAAFGGDPAKVTISGNSAGGGSVTNQMILYGGKKKSVFRGVIAEYPWWQPYHSPQTLETQYTQVLAAANCTSLLCLRSIPARTLDLASQAAQTTGYSTAHSYGYGDFYYGPTVDGTIIRDLPSHEFAQGNFVPVPLLVDRDGYEGYIFSNDSETSISQETVDLTTLFPTASASFFKRLYQVYPADNYNSTFWQREAVFGDFIIDCPTYYMATAVSDSGRDVYKMIFDAGSQLHGATVPFIFYTDESKIPNKTLALITKDYFLSFVIHQNPNTESFSKTPKPFWPTYSDGNNDYEDNDKNNDDNETGTTMIDFAVLDVQYTSMSVIEDLDASVQCDFWHGQSYVTRN